MKTGHCGPMVFAFLSILLGTVTVQPLQAQSMSGDGGLGGMGSRVRPSASAKPAPRTVRLEDILPDSVKVNLGPEESSSFIRGQVRLAGVAVTRVPVSIVSLGGKTPENLVRLRMTLEALQREVASDTAPVRLRVPSVSGPQGFNRDPEIKSSASDIARAEASADLRARKALEAFIRQSPATTITCGNPDEFFFRKLAAGRYLICLIADVRDPKAERNARARPMIWWADVTLADSQAASFAFTSENARPWQALFPADAYEE
ncbi:MAG: hypothetical protein E4H19_15010 [Chromatiales bacterium]|nr:MAG: hypothetical protein E4H19_15010 [Chromatiales bacterium]